MNLDPNFQPTNLVDVSGPATQARTLRVLSSSGSASSPGEQTFKISWTPDPASTESFHALPLLGRQKDLLGVLLVGSSQREVVTLERRIRLLAVGGRGDGPVLRNAAELVGSGARHAPGAQACGRRARSFGRELERARGRSRPQRNRPAGARSTG